MSEQTNPPSAGVGQGTSLSIEQRLANVFAAPPAAEQEPTTQPAEDVPDVAADEQQQPQDAGQADELSPDDLPDDEGETAPQPQTDEFEIVHNGSQHKLTRAETIELAQKGFDYTQKTQALAESQRKAQETLKRIAELEQVTPVLMQELAQVHAAEKALQPWQNVNWVELATNDPLEYPKYRAQYDQLVQAYQQTASQYRAKVDAVNQQKVSVARDVLQQEMSKLQSMIPGMGDPKKFGEVSAFIKSSAIADGYTAQEVDSITDARMVRTLWKASQYDKLVKGKAEKLKQVRQAPPVAKPGAIGQTQSADSKRTQQLRANLKKSGDWRDAASLLARMK